MTDHARAASLAASLAEKQAKAADLARQLAASLQVKSVWPDAFAGGCSVKLCARENVRTMDRARRDFAAGKRPKLQECYLLRSDGVRHDIDSATFWGLHS